MEEQLGEAEVIKRALAFLGEFPNLKLYKQYWDGERFRYKEVAEFTRQAEERVKAHREIVKQQRRLTYMHATPAFA